MTKYKRAFAWYGGKNSHLHWLLDLIPHTKVYAEPFAGSAAVLLNKPKSPIEVLNDLDGRIVNFFKQLRDNGEELVQNLTLTPYSRKEFADCIPKSYETFIEENPLEAARCFFVVIRQGFLAKPNPTGSGDWARAITNVRRNMPHCVSRNLSTVDGLTEIIARLKQVQIEQMDALKIIKDYDSDDSMFYLDPPYVHESRVKGCTDAYLVEQPDEFHVEMAKVCNEAEGFIAISGYDSELYEKLFESPKWRKFYPEPKKLGGKKRQETNFGMRQEVLWTNYDTDNIKKHPEQPNLMDFFESDT